MRRLALGRSFVFLLLLFLVMSYAQGIRVTDRVRLIILPGKPGTNWTQSDVDYLLAVLEEQALSLGRFQLFPRADLDKLLRERQLAELGITEAQELGKIGGYKYALLLTLSAIGAEQAGLLGGLQVVSRYTLKLYNLENGELLASKALEAYGTSTESLQRAVSATIQNMANQILIELRRFFRLEVYVRSVERNTVVLVGANVNLVRPGMLFVKEGEREPIRLRVTQVNAMQNTILAEVISGRAPTVNDVFVELVEESPPISPQTRVETTTAKPRKGITVGVGLTYEGLRTGLGGGILLHTGDLLPFLVLLASDAFDTDEGTVFTTELSLGIKALSFFGTDAYVTLGFSSFEVDGGSLSTFTVGLLGDTSSPNFGVYYYSRIFIELSAPFFLLPTQVGVRFSF